ncbi:MAG: TRAP transporter substrate-binding protein [Deltaproteobacteria bacterium]|nr:TRAP transporter substrate-binding protein [Deltaproteobacteria bacterium]
MKKKWEMVFMGVVLIAFFGMIFFPTSVVAGPVKLRYACFTPAPAFPSIQMERWKKEVEKRTGGKVAITTYNGGTLLNAKNMMDGVVAGQADIGVLVTAYQPGRFIVTNATSLPIGFPDSLVASLTLWDFYRKYKPREFDEVKVLTMFTNPPADLLTKKPMRKLEDLQGKNLRGSGGAAKVLKAWGANPIGMPISEAAESLQKGVIDGMLSSAEVMKFFKFAESCRYMTKTASVIYPFAVVMNWDSWKRLPKDVQKVMDDMATEHSIWMGEFNNRMVGETTAWSKKNYNVEVITLPKEEKARWDKKVEPITAGWIKKAKKRGLPAEKMVEDIKALARKHANP